LCSAHQRITRLWLGALGRGWPHYRELTRGPMGTRLNDQGYPFNRVGNKRTA
jgi:hypothetical protein